MARTVFPKLVATLSLVALVTSAGASDRYTPDVDYGRVTLDLPTGRGIYSTGPSLSDWNAPLGEGTAAVNPADARVKAVDWLVKHQRQDGGFGAGSWGSDDMAAPSDVATTAYVTLALLRDGKGVAKHRATIERSVDFVVRSIENAPANSPLLDTPQGTQPQYKLGQYVDTHFAAMLLGEVDGQMGFELNHRIGVAYDTVLSKVQMTQAANGSFDANGWAPVLSSSVAAQSLYTAKLKGKDIEDSVLQRSDDYQAGLIAGDGSLSTGEGAGVDLYAAATALRANDQVVKREAAAPSAGPDTDRRVAEATEARGAATSRITSDDGRLMAGFGSIGGEELLSYQMISDTLAENGGQDWDKWSQQIGTYLVNVQNQDGSWSGQHCITSTVFTTAGGVMTLSAGDWVSHKASLATPTKPSRG